MAGMPTSQSTARRLQCPFCATISARGTGLSSHVRSQHPREYAKWNKNPNKLVDAAGAASATARSGKNSRARTVTPVSVDVAADAVRASNAEPTGNSTPLSIEHRHKDGKGTEARNLVQKAYEQLSARKESIEAELARIDALQSEHAAVTAQVAALREAMTAFGEEQKQ
jgi:hypothetical protein